MRKQGQPALRLVWSVDSAGYKSGRRSCREMPVRDSIAKTRSAGARPKDIQPDTVPCDLNPSDRARALCPSAASQAASNASLGVIVPINAQTVNRVNAESGNQRVKNGRMAKRQLDPSPFWRRLDEALGKNEKYAPLNSNSLATKLDMSQGSVHRWYTGAGLPELDTALKLAKDGGVCVDWLLNNVKPKFPISRDPLLRELFEICEALFADGRESVLRHAKGELLLQRAETIGKAG